MKKILVGIIVLLSSFFMIENVSAVECKNKINVYIFSNKSCPHCAAALKYFNSIEKEYSKCFTLVNKEVSKSQENHDAFVTVAEYLGKESNGVPFIVIGKESYIGWGENVQTEMIDTIVKNANSDKYSDQVEKAINGEKRENNPIADTIITTLIIAISLGGFVTLFITGKK